MYDKGNIRNMSTSPVKLIQNHLSMAHETKLNHFHYDHLLHIFIHQSDHPFICTIPQPLSLNY